MCIYEEEASMASIIITYTPFHLDDLQVDQVETPRVTWIFKCIEIHLMIFPYMYRLSQFRWHWPMQRQYSG